MTIANGTQGISTHTPLARRDCRDTNILSRYIYFYSHASCEARRALMALIAPGCDFYSHASCEARLAELNYIQCLTRNFYSHASCEARLLQHDPPHLFCQFLLTRLLRGATSRLVRNCIYKLISTHTPLARRDFFHVRDPKTIAISTHTPLARRDGVMLLSTPNSNGFLLTRLLRGATNCNNKKILCSLDFYSHASCEARLYSLFSQKLHWSFLLTRLLRGATTCLSALTAQHISFLLTRLLRGATALSRHLSLLDGISTHTPLARRDLTSESLVKPLLIFLLTRLLRGATL